MSFGASSSYHSLQKKEESIEVSTNDSGQRNSSSFLQRKFPRIQGGWAEVLLACSAITLPMLLLSCLLLGLVFANHLPPTHSIFQDHAVDARLYPNPGNAYLVNLSATKLITVASWASSIAPHLPTFLMTLVSFPLARQLYRHSHQDEAHKLPTPYQLTLMMELRNGSLKSLWTYLRYANRKGGVKPVAALSQSAMVFTLATILGYLILAADTWLHVTTSTVYYTQLYTPYSPSWSYGRGLPAACYLGDTTCSMVDTGVAWYLSGAPESFRTLYNTSTVTSVLTFEIDGQTYAYVADGPYAYEKDSTFDPGFFANLTMLPEIGQADFTTSTFATSTTCMPITAKCNPAKNSSGCMNFQCSEAFGGSLGCSNLSTLNAPIVNAFGLGLFFDEQLTKGMSRQDFAQEGTLHNHSFNPFHIGTYATVSTGNGGSSQLNSSTNLVHGVPGGDSWVLSCSVTVWDAIYTLVNQTVVSANVSVSNSTTAATFAWPFWGNFGLDVIQRAAVLGDFSSTMEGVAEQTALAISTTALALVSGILVPRPDILDQSRDDPILVARVPKAPLFTLITLNLLFVAAGICFAVMAANTHPALTRNVQARMDTSGLVAAKFEDEDESMPVQARSVKDFFAENRTVDGASSSRIGIAQTQVGTWKYRVWQAD